MALVCEEFAATGPNAQNSTSDWRSPTEKSLSELMEAYLLSCKRRGLSIRTCSVYRGVLEAISKDLDLERATTDDIDGWLNSREIGAVTRSSYLSALRNFYRYCVQRDLLDSDPTARIERSKLPRRLPRPITEGDLSQALFKASPRMRAILSLAAFTGLRASEIASLKRDNFDFEAKLVRVCGKGSVERVVPIAHDVEIALRAYGLHANYLFGTQRSQGQKQRITREVSVYFQGLGMPWRAHSLRHFFGSNLYARTRDLLFVAHMMGHSSVATTIGYTKLSPTPEATEAVRGMTV